MIKMAIFDIDFTITKKETLMQFYRFLINRDVKNIKFLPRALFSGLLYGIKVYDERRVKEAFLKFIENIHEKDLAVLTKEFYHNKLTKILYQDALDMIRKLKKEGYMVVLISASPEFYIKEFYAIDEVDLIIGTRFVFEEGIFRRKMHGNNCKGEEKVKRLMEVINDKKLNVDFQNSYMFSDSLSDKPLLDLVGRPYLINYKKRHQIESLKWK